MKKIKYIVLTFILLIGFMCKVDASTNTYERNEENNYGVNKKWKMNGERKNKALKTPYVNAEEKIYDFSDILTDSEEEELYKLMTNFINHTEMDIVFVSDNVPYTSEYVNEDYAADFYDYNDFGLNFDIYSGVIIFRNTYENDPYYGLYTFGNAQLYFNHDRTERALDNMYYNFKNGYYLAGMTKLINELTSYYDSGVADKNLYVDDMGYVREKDSSKLARGLLLGIPVSGIITLIVMLILVAKNKMIKMAYNAQEYGIRNSLKFSDKRDVFITSHTTSYTHSSSSGGGGGGGHSSSHSGSSGGGHGGGGRHG